MKVLVLEDDPTAISIIEFLNKSGYNVCHAQNLLDVAYFLEEDPGLESFNKLMFDAAVSIEAFSFMDKKEIRYGTKYGFSGFEFLAENYDILSSKSVAMITAYNKTLQELNLDGNDKKILAELTIIDKSADDFMNQLLEFLNE